MPFKTACQIGLTATALLVSEPAVAQVAPVPLPPPTDLTRPQAPIRSPARSLSVSPPPASAIPDGAETTMIEVSGIELVGVTAYTSAELQPDYARLIGHRVALAELFRAAARIEEHYRRDGYVLTRAIVPSQEPADNRYRLQVVEGFVSAVELTGSPGRDEALIKRYIDPVTRARPVTISAIERALLLVQGLPGIEAHGVLTPAVGTPGGAHLVVEVHQRPIAAYATLNNRGSRFAGPITGTVGFDLNGVGAGGHLGGLYFTTFNREQNYLELDVDQRVGANGFKVRGFASYATSHPGSVLAPLDIASRNYVLGVGADYPLVLSRAVKLIARGSFEFTDDRSDVLGSPDSRDRQRIIRLGLSAEAPDALQGVSSFSITAHKGLNILDASRDGGSVPQSRLGGQSEFFKLTATASHFQPLATAPWGGLALQVSTAGQYAANRLLSLEQFHVGGEAFGRGFNPSQYAGDDGAAADIELQLTHARAIGALTGQQLYAFFDAASVHDRGVAGWRQIDSAGGGLRFDLGTRLSGQLEVAVPYNGGRQVGAVLDRGAQGFFRLTARY